MSDHFCLKWNNFHNSILSAFESLHSSEELVDVTLMCEGRNVKAHKVILSACSPYFRNLFKETPCQHPIIILKDVLHCDLLAILQFMYQGEVLVTQENLSSFLKTAELLQVTGLAGNTSTQVPHTPVAATEPTLAPVPPLVHIPARSITPTTNSPLTLSTPPNDVSLTKLVEKENVSTEDEALPDEPMQSCSYPHDELVIKTETEDPDFPEMEFANVNEENMDEIRPSTDESILKRSLKAQGISPHPTKQYTMDVTVLGPQISTITTPTQSTSPKSDLKIASIQARTLTKPNADLLAKESAKRKARASPDVAVPLPKRLPPKTDAKKSKPECRTELPKIDAISPHGSQFGICPHCNKVYSNQSALKYHVRLVHSDMLNMFCCHLCPESFEYRDVYKSHMWETHSVRN